MSETFLGFPLQTWALVCLAVAAFYYVKWPKPRPDPQAPPRSAAAHFILRLFHSLVWLLLAGACFLWAGGNTAPATVLAALALIVYLIFLATLTTDRGRR